MGYADEFLDSRTAAKDLLSETGYSTDQAASAVAGIGELCVLSSILRQMIKGHEKGELLPPRSEVSLSVEPIKLQRTEEVNLLKSLEECNAIVSLGSQKYRAMLSTTLNRLFALTARNARDSIRSSFSGIGDSGPLESALERVEWEIVESVHDHIDAKYLEIDELESQMIPKRLIDLLEQATRIVKSLDEIGGWTMKEEGLLSAPAIDMVKAYFNSVRELSRVLQDEVEKQKILIGRFNVYPRSFVGRKTAPLAGSSWNLRSDFKDHPLIQKFLLLIESNHAKLAHLADVYEDHVTAFVNGLKNLPDGVRILETLNESVDDLPAVADIQDDWSLIKKRAASLIGQAKFVEVYVASMDTLFPERKDD